jgi:lipoprotein-anchoring transpeptidase ErfK/SrfK
MNFLKIPALPAAGRLLTAAALLLLAACSTPHSIQPGETVRKAVAVDAKTLDAMGIPAALPPEKKPKTSTGLYSWHGADLSGALEVTIDLSAQKAYFTRGGQPAGWSYVASGKSGYRTPTGSFRVTEKVRDKKSTSWGRIINSAGRVVVSDAKAGRDGGGRFVGASMPFWMRFAGAVGMHAGNIPNPGSPASHGCVRLPRGMAEILFAVVQIGTPVRVVP